MRAAARLAGDVEKWQNLERAIRKSVRQDKRKWVENAVGTGDWDQLKVARKKFSSKQTSLKTREGELCSMREVANVQADQYEKVQWKINTTEETVSNLRNRAQCYTSENTDSSNFNMQDITVQEVVDASKTMKNMKSDKPSKIPNEAWKLIVQDCDVAQKLAIFSVRASKMLSCQNNGIKQ